MRFLLSDPSSVLVESVEVRGSANHQVVARRGDGVAASVHQTREEDRRNAVDLLKEEEDRT